MPDFCYLIVTCKNAAEATKVAQHLLEKRLVACAKQTKLDRVDFWWQDKIESGEETLLIMESREDLFDEVEAELEKVHSYDTFVLEMLPVKRVSRRAADWINENLHQD